MDNFSFQLSGMAIPFSLADRTRISAFAISKQGIPGPNGPLSVIANVSDLAAPTNKYVLIGDGTEFVTRFLATSDVTGLVTALSDLASADTALGVSIASVQSDLNSAFGTLSAADAVLQAQIDAITTATSPVSLINGGTGADNSLSVGVWLQDPTTHDFSVRLLTAADVATGTFGVGQIPNLPGNRITSSFVGLGVGGTGVDLSATGGATFVLAQAADHTVSARALIAIDIPSLDASKITTGTFALARLTGITTSELSATAGILGTQLSATAGIASGQITSLASTKITGTFGDAYISDVSLSKLTAGTLGVDLVINPAKIIDWGTSAGSGTVSATSAQIVNSSSGIKLNVPSGKIFSLSVNGTEMLGNNSSDLNLSVPSSGKIYMNDNAVTGSIAQFDINRWLCPTVIRFSAAGIAGATRVEIYGSGASGSMFLNVPTGQNQIFNVNNVAQQTFGINGIALNTAAGTVGTSTRGIYTISTGLAINVETGATVGSYVNGVLQQSQGVNGLTLNTAAGTITAGTRGLYTTSVGVFLNSSTSTTIRLGINGVAEFDVSATSLISRVGSVEYSRLDTNGLNGSLVSSSTVSNGSGTSPNQAAVDCRGRWLLVANNGNGASGSSVSNYTINQDTGALTIASAGVAAGTTGGNYVSNVAIDGLGRFAYAPNYFDGSVNQYSINQTTGVLTVVGTAVASGTNSHGVACEPTGRFAYVTNLGADTLSQFSINQSTGALTSIATAVATGSGPYKIACDPSGRFVYLTNTNALTVSQFSINQTTGALTSIAADVAVGVSSLEGICIDPSGLFVAVTGSNGTSTDLIVVYLINQTTGALTLVGSTNISGSGVSNTFRICYDSTGKFLYAPNSIGSTVYQFLVNSTGTLTQLGPLPSITGPIAIACDPLGRFAWTSGITNQIATLKNSIYAPAKLGAISPGILSPNTPLLFPRQQTAPLTPTTARGIWADYLTQNYNVETGSTHSFKVNNVVQQTLSINGIQLNTLAGTVTAGTRGIYTIAAGLTYNAETGKAHTLSINGTAVLTVDPNGTTSAANLFTIASSLRFSASTTITASAYEIGKNSTTQLAMNVPTGGTIANLVNGVVQQIFDVNGIQFSVNGTLTASSYQIGRNSSSNMVYNVPTSRSNVLATNNVAVLTANSAGINFDSDDSGTFVFRNASSAQWVKIAVNGIDLSVSSKGIKFGASDGTSYGNTDRYLVGMSNGIDYNTTATTSQHRFLGAGNVFANIYLARFNFPAGNASPVSTEYEIYKDASGIGINVPTGMTVRIGVNGVTQQTLNINGLTFNTAAGVTTASARQIVPQSTGLVYGVGSSQTHLFCVNDVTQLNVGAGLVATPGVLRFTATGSGTAGQAEIYYGGYLYLNTPSTTAIGLGVNGVTQVFAGVNGLTFATSAGTVTAGTRGLYTLSTGLVVNTETGTSLALSVNNVAQFTAAAGIISTPGVLRYTGAGSATAAQVEIYADASAGNLNLNTPTNKTISFLTNNVAQQAFNIHGIQLSTGAGTVQAAIRGIYQTSTGVAINSPTGTSIANAINGTNVQTQDSTNCTLTTNLVLSVAGNTIKIKQGTNASAGTGTLVAGEATIPTTAIATGDLVFVVRSGAGGTVLGDLGEVLSSRVNGTSFLVRSVVLGGVGATATLDTSTFVWWILKAA